jgi:tripartite-type tricarboxylate transporter receptor subunit TctC
MTLIRRSLAGLLLALAASAAFAQAAYPSRPVRIVVPYPAGGGTDLLARVVAAQLTTRWGQQVVVENRPGASGNLGLEQVAKSPADGYTLVMMPSNHSINPPLFGKLPFDPIASFTPIVAVGSSPILLAVRNELGVRNVRELLAAAKAKPGALSYASCGNGTPQHLAGELFKGMAQVDLTHVPYKGCAPAVTDFVGGQLQVTFSTVANLSQYLKAGRVTGLAVTSSRRSPLVPELPTVAESGLPGYDVDVWFGLLGPAQLPAEVVNRINTDVNAALADPALKERLQAQFFDVLGGSPQAFGTLIRNDLQRWGKLIRDVGIKVD